MSFGLTRMGVGGLLVLGGVVALLGSGNPTLAPLMIPIGLVVFMTGFRQFRRARAMAANAHEAFNESLRAIAEILPPYLPSKHHGSEYAIASRFASELFASGAFSPDDRPEAVAAQAVWMAEKTIREQPAIFAEIVLNALPPSKW